MTNGSPEDQERALARAIELGVNYLDTAAQYGDGRSEINLGRLIAKLKPAAAIGTKLRLTEHDKHDINGAVAAGMAESLRRLGRDQVDIYHLHNAITSVGMGADLTPSMVLDGVLPAFDTLRRQGKTRFIGFTAVGDTDALHALVESGAFDTAQVVYNLLNPTAGTTRIANYAGQDYNNLLTRMQQKGMGAIGIRVLAGGALSLSAVRHPISSPAPAPIGSGDDFQTDLAWAEKFRPLVTEGHAETVAEAALRYATANPLIPTTLIGIATPEEFEAAAQATLKGPLSQTALDRIALFQQDLKS